MRLAEGEPALLIDSKDRHFLLKLESGRVFQFHNGAIPHDRLIGSEDGSWVETDTGATMLLIRPRLADFILKMKRGAQVVYPKDLGPILIYGDIGPGMTVVEAGTGSGAVTLALARAVGETGRVVTVERRPDHAAQAKTNIERWFGGIPPQVEIREGEVAGVVAEVRPERIVLDLPEPEETIRVAAEHQPTGGVMCVYLPTVPQLQSAVDAARASGGFSEIEIKEFLFRDWNVSGRSVRPEHSMIGHTGFLMFMRRVATRR